MAKGVLVDVSKCIGCRSCFAACKQWNQLPPDEEKTKPTWDRPPDMTGNTWTAVKPFITERDGQVQWRFVKEQCRHCLEPACESVCFVHAFVKTEQGPVIYYGYRCVGCRYCMLACPFAVPKYEWERIFPEVKKCRFCFDPDGSFDRLGKGEEPACVSACPTGALKFGEREELLAEARNRIAGSPGRYVDRIYGEREYGGTSWLYISDVPFEQIGFRTDASEKSIPHWTGRITRWTLPIGVGWAAALTALYLYSRSRQTQESEEQEEAWGGE
ncbi:MAG: 4Fe-4S dicluster domain-containing protein [Clostridia bacterium]|nr:4Fe-4S dicluster domain-containing protein [Clostridia bacterium]MDH7572863.1 4Fe-4S dicluster domain-containing protein [Clostridia bacterium]